MRFKIIFLLWCFPFFTQAQNQRQQMIKELMETVVENIPEDYDLSELEEQLLFFNTHPIDLNHTNESELKKLPFLSPIQIGALFEHLQKHGDLIDVLELQQIETFNTSTIRQLLPFVTIQFFPANEQLTFHNLTQLGNHELLIRAATWLETPKGLKDLPGSSYSGSKERLMFKYKYTFGSRISASFVMEKDAGEKLFGYRSPFSDYQSGHFGVYKWGKFEKIIVGDYTLQFGQGLTLWSGFTYGKAPDVASVVTKDIGLKAYTSANEYAFFRGIATKIQLANKWSATAFFSSRKLDASLDLDTGGNFTLATINQTGLHRTSSEIENKNSLGQRLFGNIITYQTDQFTIGCIGYHQMFNHRFTNGPQAYTYHRFIGQSLINVGLYYHFNYRNGYYFGEVSKGSTGGWAYLNGALVSISNRLSAVFVHRYYAPNYHNFYSQAMAEGGESSNEIGFYGGFNYIVDKSFTLSFYIDHFKFPWLKFRIDAPSYGNEYLLQLAYIPNKRFKTVLRYKAELKQQNTAEEVPINFLEEVKKSVYTLSINWQRSKSLELQHRAEFVQFQKGTAATAIGYLICQDVDYSPSSAKISGNIRLAYFYSQRYESRMYAYEDDVLYNFSFGMYNGKGWRTYLNLKYPLAKRISIWYRYALFFYPKATVVGSGLDEIEGNTKSEMKLQMRIQF